MDNKDLILEKHHDWILEQARTIGSSAAGVCAGESPYMTPFELWHVIRRAIHGDIHPSALNDDMRRGLLTEPLHRGLLADELGMVVTEHPQNQFIYNDEYPWAHALPDGWLYPGEGEEGLEIPVQLKCPRPRAWHTIQREGIHGYWLLGSQHSIAVCDVNYEHFSVLNPETMRLVHFPVHRDDELISGLMDIEHRFYESIMADEPPESNEVEHDLPDLSGDLLRLTDQAAIDAAQAFLEAKDMMKDAEELLEECKAKVKELVGEVECAELPGLRVYQSVNEGRKTLDRKAMQSDGIDLEPYEKRGKPFTTTRFYPLKQA